MTDPTLVRPSDNEEEDVHGHQDHEHTKKKKALTDDWRSWLILNVARGCDRHELFDRCVVEHGFDEADVLEAMDRYDQEDQKKEQVEEKKVNGEEDENEKKIQTRNNIDTTSTTHNKAVNNGWKEWIRVRLDQGNTKEQVFLLCVKEGLNLDQVSQVLGGYRARTHEDAFLVCPKPAFAKRTFTPRAWRIDSDLVDLYEIPHFLTKEECQDVIHAINTGMLERSIVTDGNAAARTSQTCHLRRTNDTRSGIIRRVEDKLQKLMGEDCRPVSHAETLQGQCYSAGEYFSAHTDWFEPDSEEYNKHCQRGGQRTWTVMVYLNNVTEGGETKFVHLERDFMPRQGWALAWNNLDADHETPNPWTLHEAMPVMEGKKYVLTKWFREKSMT
ncbi:Probable prolyl 4-hydroxylase [Seminavis robusta]|uniref:Probable prolyl 4-hydroxylase n=1 Tax=Seminavis robusta TaxID=568900 RepID=A0A9N8H3G1_9STRA|nr:Probable prolyl 4-hydroxylase [Seminavis robusta]|eukprot:Sro26_g017430.1 Probable prolyl 4-hydroxylase (386) ;mRNA; f:7296-8453